MRVLFDVRRVDWFVVTFDASLAPFRRGMQLVGRITLMHGMAVKARHLAMVMAVRSQQCCVLAPGGQHRTIGPPSLLKKSRGSFPAPAFASIGQLHSLRVTPGAARSIDASECRRPVGIAVPPWHTLFRLAHAE